MKEKTQILIGLVILAALSIGAYFLLGKVWTLFKSIDPQLGAGLIVASATVIVSVISILFSKRQEHKIDISNQLREKKLPIYEKIIEVIFLITFAEKIGKEQPSEEELIKFFADTTRDLVIWGSKDILVAFANFKDGIAELSEGENAAKAMISVEDFLFALRKDLGHSDSKKRGDILRLYINDLPEYFP